MPARCPSCGEVFPDATPGETDVCVDSDREAHEITFVEVSPAASTPKGADDGER